VATYHYFVDVVKSDEFTGNLLKLAQDVYTHDKPVDSDVRLHLLRNDFLPTDGDTRILQVEINTISAAFAGIIESLSLIHFTHQHIYYRDLGGELPINRPCSGFANAMFLAVREHNKKWGTSSMNVLFITEDGEKNIVDQYALERSLAGEYRITVIRRSLGEVVECSHIGIDGQLYVDNIQVALAYFRSGYDPKHYPSQKEWDARRLIEKSRTVKCPSLLTQLAGTKKVQQSWYENNGNILRQRFGLSDSQVTGLLTVFARQGIPSEDSSIVEMVLSKPNDWVMKPQREGGGHNLYGHELVKALQTCSPHELSQYVLMERMKPVPAPALVVDGEASSRARRVVPCIVEDAVSELGIYSYYIPSIGKNEICGHLLRTKSSLSAEGGVNAGFAVLDTIQLL
jgi:glutathione synthetase